MDLKFAIAFTAIDQMSDRITRIGEGMFKFGNRTAEAGEKLSRMGERMVEWGERIGIVTAILSEGANKLHEWSESLSEPAMGMEKSMATMRAMTGLAGGAFTEVKERARRERINERVAGIVRTFPKQRMYCKDRR